MAVERHPTANGSAADGVVVPPRCIRVIVEDRGPGIPANERLHIFERFYRGSRSGQRASSEGTGLGLSLVAEHVRLHGGQVWIEDTPGGGSRFIVELPFTAEDASDSNGSMA